MIKAVFFDLDGILCDSDTSWSIAIRETLQLFSKLQPDISEANLTKAWATIHQNLFQQLDAGKCSMAEVRDLRFPYLFEELNLSQVKLQKNSTTFSVHAISRVYVFTKMSRFLRSYRHTMSVSLQTVHTMNILTANF